MKRLLTLSVVFLLIFTVANAQKKNVNSANASLTAGKLDKAKEAIDLAIEHEDTKTMANQICAKLKRNMSQKEWNKYVAKDISYEKTCDALPNGEGVK